MKIVIDIPEYIYKICQNHGDIVYKSIANGTPLPKGHGRLVDMSEVLIKLMQFYDGDKTIGQCLDEVNTIIEAEGSNKE